MQRYKNAGESGVQFFKTGKDFIILEFGDAKQHLYNSEKPGKTHVKKMITLADKGSKLNTYINKYIRDNYAERLK